MKIHHYFIIVLLIANSTFTMAETCQNILKPKLPINEPPRYVDANTYSMVKDDTVEIRDNWTGLIWQRCSLGQTWVKNLNTKEYICSGSASGYTWAEALKAAKDVGNGYRLPNIKELQSLTQENCGVDSIAINGVLFPNAVTLNYYWSSSSNARNGNLAWGVRFYDGYSGNDSKMNKNYVRLVRGGR